MKGTHLANDKDDCPFFFFFSLKIKTTVLTTLTKDDCSDSLIFLKIKMTVLPEDEDDCSDSFFFIKIKTILHLFLKMKMTVLPKYEDNTTSFIHLPKDEDDCTSYR